MLLKIDGHVHTELSNDSNANWDAILQEAHRKGLDGLIVVDHNLADGEPEIPEKYSNLHIIRGGEYSTEDGHLIVIGLRTPLENICPFENGRFKTACILNQAREQNAFVILAHPYRWRHRLPSDDLLKRMDALEVYNSRNAFLLRHPKANQMAQEAARRLNMPVLGGSDAHVVEEIGNCIVEIDTLGMAFDINQLRCYDIKVIGKHTSPKHVLISQWIKASHYKRHLVKFKYLIKYIIETFLIRLYANQIQEGLFYEHKGEKNR